MEDTKSWPVTTTCEESEIYHFLSHGVIAESSALISALNKVRFSELRCLPACESASFKVALSTTKTSKRDRRQRKNFISAILSGLKKERLKYLSEEQVFALALRIAYYLCWLFRWLLRQKPQYTTFRFIEKKKYRYKFKRYILPSVRQKSLDASSLLDMVTNFIVTFVVEKVGVLSCRTILSNI